MADDRLIVGVDRTVMIQVCILNIAGMHGTKGRYGNAGLEGAVGVEIRSGKIAQRLVAELGIERPAGHAPVRVVERGGRLILLEQLVSGVGESSFPIQAQVFGKVMRRRERQIDAM